MHMYTQGWDEEPVRCSLSTIPCLFSLGQGSFGALESCMPTVHKP